MRITSPPKFIMSISFIMSLIITLVVFQCKAGTVGGEPREGENQGRSAYTICVAFKSK